MTLKHRQNPELLPEKCLQLESTPILLNFALQQHNWTSGTYSIVIIIVITKKAWMLGTAKILGRTLDT